MPPRRGGWGRRGAVLHPLKAADFQGFSGDSGELKIFLIFLKEFPMVFRKEESGKTVRHRMPIRLTMAKRPQTDEEIRKTQAALTLLLTEMVRQRFTPRGRNHESGKQ